MSSVIPPSLEEMMIIKGYALPFLLLRELKIVEEGGLLPSRAWQRSSSKQQKLFPMVPKGIQTCSVIAV